MCALPTLLSVFADRLAYTVPHALLALCGPATARQQPFTPAPLPAQATPAAEQEEFITSPYATVKQEPHEQTTSLPPSQVETCTQQQPLSGLTEARLAIQRLIGAKTPQKLTVAHLSLALDDFKRRRTTPRSPLSTALRSSKPEPIHSTPRRRRHSKPIVPCQQCGLSKTSGGTHDCRMFGRYACGRCTAKWTAPFMWASVTQKCHRCGSSTHPFAVERIKNPRLM